MYICCILYVPNEFSFTFSTILHFQAEKNTAHAKKLKALLLRLALKESRAEGERRIYIQLPEETDHCNHERGIVCISPFFINILIASFPHFLTHSQPLQKQLFS